MVQTRTKVSDESERGVNEGALLAAALAATLVEYRRDAGLQSESRGSLDERSNWRTVACWERLRGRA